MMLENVLAQVVTAQDALALAVDDLALLVHDVVVLEHALADLEVLLLHLLLRALHRAGDQAVLDGDVLVDAQPVHQPVDAVAAEDAQQVVLEGDDELADARVALAPGTAAELVVDAPRLVPLGAQDEQPARPRPLPRPA